MRSGSWVVGLVLLLAGCTSSGPWRPVTDWVQVRPLVNRADALARDGDHAGARAVYEQVAQEHPASSWAPRALFHLARLEVTTESPIHDYQQAYAHFDRVVKDYPASAYAADARAWRDMLAELLSREQEAVRIRRDIERLKRLEQEQEREAARTRSDLERLKKSDVELETKRP